MFIILVYFINKPARVLVPKNQYKRNITAEAPMDSHGLLWTPTVFHRLSWTPMDSHGLPWTHMNSHSSYVVFVS